MQPHSAGTCPSHSWQSRRGQGGYPQRIQAAAPEALQTSMQQRPIHHLCCAHTHTHTLSQTQQDRTSRLVDFQAKHTSTLAADLLQDIQHRLQAGGGQLPVPPSEPDITTTTTTSAPTTSAAPATAMAKGTVMTRRRGGILAAAAANATAKQSGPMSTPNTRGSANRLPKHGEVFYSENGTTVLYNSVDCVDCTTWFFIQHMLSFLTFFRCFFSSSKCIFLTPHTGSPLGTYEQAHAHAPGYLATPMVGGGVHQAPLGINTQAGAAPGMVTIVNTNAKRRWWRDCVMCPWDCVGISCVDLH